jgi:hypothetical protein
MSSISVSWVAFVLVQSSSTWIKIRKHNQQINLRTYANIELCNVLFQGIFIIVFTFIIIIIILILLLLLPILKKRWGSHVLRVLLKIEKNWWGAHVLRVLSNIAKNGGGRMSLGCFQKSQNFRINFQIANANANLGVAWHIFAIISASGAIY